MSKQYFISRYSVDIHFPWGWDVYDVFANGFDNARYSAILRIINELGLDYASKIDCMRVYKHGTDILLKEYNY